MEKKEEERGRRKEHWNRLESWRRKGACDQVAGGRGVEWEAPASVVRLKILAFASLQWQKQASHPATSLGRLTMDESGVVYLRGTMGGGILLEVNWPVNGGKERQDRVYNQIDRPFTDGAHKCREGSLCWERSKFFIFFYHIQHTACRSSSGHELLKLIFDGIQGPRGNPAALYW